MNVAMVAAGGAGISLAAAVAQLEGMSLPRRGRRDPPGAAGGAGAYERPAPATGSPRAAVGLVTRIAPAALAACAAFLLAGAGPAIAVAATVAAVQEYRSRRARGAQRKERERAAPSLARALADALRGGSSVRSALAEAAVDRSVPAVLRDELASLAAAMQLGAPVPASIHALAERGGPGLRLLCGTVVMHLEAGGALAGQLDRIAADGETALRIDEDRVAATAQARATVRVVAALPVLALGGAEVASNHFLATIAGSPIALALLITGFVLEALAVIAARAIVGPA